MIRLLTRMFARPTPHEYALRKLEEHQRELIEARRIAQASAVNVIFHERSIADLKRSLVELAETGERG